MSDAADEDASQDTNEDHDDYNDGDRDRRAIDEEDDEDFFQELNSLAEDVKRGYVNLIFKYVSLRKYVDDSLDKTRKRFTVMDALPGIDLITGRWKTSLSCSTI